MVGLNYLIWLEQEAEFLLPCGRMIDFSLTVFNETYLESQFRILSHLKVL